MSLKGKVAIVTGASRGIGQANALTLATAGATVVVYGPFVTTHVERNHLVGVATLGERMFFSLVYSELESSAAQIEQLQQKA